MLLALWLERCQQSPLSLDPRVWAYWLGSPFGLEPLPLDVGQAHPEVCFLCYFSLRSENCWRRSPLSERCGFLLVSDSVLKCDCWHPAPLKSARMTLREGGGGSSVFQVR